MANQPSQGLLLFVREFGTPNFKDIVLQTKSKQSLEQVIKASFGLGPPFHFTSLVDTNASISVSEQEIFSLNNGASLEIKFVNKVRNRSHFTMFILFSFIGFQSKTKYKGGSNNLNLY
jgi:hypothetical protein